MFCDKKAKYGLKHSKYKGLKCQWVWQVLKSLPSDTPRNYLQTIQEHRKPQLILD